MGMDYFISLTHKTCFLAFEIEDWYIGSWENTDVHLDDHLYIGRDVSCTGEGDAEDCKNTETLIAPTLTAYWSFLSLS